MKLLKWDTPQPCGCSQGHPHPPGSRYSWTQLPSLPGAPTAQRRARDQGQDTDSLLPRPRLRAGLGAAPGGWVSRPGSPLHPGQQRYWPCGLPRASGQAASRRSSHLRPGRGPTHITCHPVPGLRSPWPSISGRGAGPGRLRPGRRYLSETVLQALERGAPHGASCKNPTLMVLAGQSSGLQTPGALPEPRVHCSWSPGPVTLAQGTQTETWPRPVSALSLGGPGRGLLIFTAYREKPVSRPAGH